MALRLDPIRLFIADDVGVGKTIEALLVAREMLDRGEIKRVCILTPPSLCDQWQTEMTQKMNLDPVVIRSGTISQLELRKAGTESIYRYYPVQIASIDFIKSDRNRHLFLQDCPDLVIVDEAHGAASASAANQSQQQRHELLRDIAAKNGHLILLTATPHCGVDAAFRSLLGLLKPEFAQWDMAQLDDERRKTLARHFVQRTRKDIETNWEGDHCFPFREVAPDETFRLSPAYRELFDKTYEFCSEMVRTGATLDRRQQRVRYWGALALLRCVMSSPAAAVAALQARHARLAEAAGDDEPDFGRLIFESTDEQTDDEQPLPAVEAAEETLEDVDKRRLRDLARLASAMPLYEAKMLHQFDHRFSTYEGATEQQLNVGILPQPSSIQKRDPNFVVQPRYWVEQGIVDSAIPKFPEPLAEAVAREDAEGVRYVLGVWAAGYLFNRGRTVEAREQLGLVAMLEVGNRVRKALDEFDEQLADAAEALESDYPLDEYDFSRLAESRADPTDLAGELIERFSPKWLMGWRDITNTTNERTLIASTAPLTAVGHKFQLILSHSNMVDARLALPILNSFVVDYAARQKFGGTSLSYFVLRQLPVLTPSAVKKRFLLPRMLELVATASDIMEVVHPHSDNPDPFVWDDDRRFQIRCELDAVFFGLYLPSETDGAWKPARVVDRNVIDETPEHLGPSRRDSLTGLETSFIQGRFVYDSSFMDGRELADLVGRQIQESQRGPLPALTQRDVRLPQVPRKAIAVVGMRRAGKTSFLWQLISERVAAGTPREGLLYFNFEDERLAGLGLDQLSVIVEEYYRLNPEWRDARRATWMLDEIQLVPGWERFARRLLDTEQIDLFLSGSSAKLLSREVATSMRGRGMEAIVDPFSFREYLRHHGREPREPANRLPKARRSSLQKDLRAYLRTGGFPEAQSLAERDRRALLTTYVDVTLLRDVVERHSVSSPVALRWMTRQLLGNPAGAFSIHRFYNDLRALKTPASKDTLHAYLAHLEDAFLVRTIPVATGSERRRMVNPRKVYPADPGLIAVFDRAARANLGHALESVVLLVLQRRGADVSYVRTGAGHEVDFLAQYPGGAQQLIQVCADLSAGPTRERDVRALAEAADEYPRATRHILTLTPEAASPWPAGVTVHGAEQWLLAEDHQD
jgi:predicted AAA+ superfamily ATPase